MVGSMVTFSPTAALYPVSKTTFRAMEMSSTMAQSWAQSALVLTMRSYSFASDGVVDPL